MLEHILGNAALRQDLIAALQSNRLPNALLLCGENGLGKGFLARCLAADYLYPAGGAGAQAVMEGRSAEVIEVEGEGASGQIPVQRIREMRSQIMGTALSAAGRAVILYEAQNLNAASANALLKILEEPPEGVLFLLTAPGAASVLATIRSRCSAYTVTAPGREEGIPFLRQNGAESDAAFYYDVYGGKLGLGLACIQQEGRRQILEDAKCLAEDALRQNAYGLCCILSRYEKDKAGARILLSDGTQVLASQVLSSPAEGQAVYQAAAHAARLCSDAERSLRRGGNPKLILTALAVKLAEKV